ncbi:MAG: type II toxin-antitoxin system ParD family antitoxin [Thermomicrobiales bacterium]
MNVSLTPHLEAMVREKVETGQYRNASEVVRDALSQMEERDRRLAELRTVIAIADKQIARGEVVEWTPELRASIMHEARAAATAGKQPKADVLP